MSTVEQRETARSVVETAIWHFVAAGSWMTRVQRRKREISLDVRREVVHFGMDADGQLRLVIDMTAPTAYARPRDVSGNNLHCVSKGTLERRIEELIAEGLAGEPTR